MSPTLSALLYQIPSLAITSSLSRGSSVHVHIKVATIFPNLDKEENDIHNRQYPDVDIHKAGKICPLVEMG